jgi:hypothetical protein
VTAFVGFQAHAVLTNENEGREKYRLKGHLKPVAGGDATIVFRLKSNDGLDIGLMGFERGKSAISLHRSLQGYAGTYSTACGLRAE